MKKTLERSNELIVCVICDICCFESSFCTMVISDYVIKLYLFTGYVVLC